MLNPFRGFMDLQSEIERMMGEMFPARRAQAGWVLAVDVVSKDGDLVIRAELPGVKREDVDVTVHNGVLTISGERKEEREEKEAGYLLRERRYGSFRRSMSLPEGASESDVKATFEDGVLEVTVKGAAAVTEPKRIRIEG